MLTETASWLIICFFVFFNSVGCYVVEVTALHTGYDIGGRLYGVGELVTVSIFP